MGMKRRMWTRCVRRWRNTPIVRPCCSSIAKARASSWRCRTRGGHEPKDTTMSDGHDVSRLFAVSFVFVVFLVLPARAQTIEPLNLRGHVQSLHVYGVRGGPPVVLSSGDGGWIHLAPHVADVLAAHGYFVVGFDARAYLSSFTDGRSGLRPNDVGADYLALTRFAAQGSHARPILIGVSEGAGLSVLAACDPAAK